MRVLDRWSWLVVGCLAGGLCSLFGCPPPGSCARDEDCSAGRCDKFVGLCVVLDGGLDGGEVTCGVSVCASDQVCRNNTCVNAACADATCEPGKVCRKGNCEGCPADAKETSCSNLSDDDCDALVDCADPDCDGKACRPVGGSCDVLETCPGNGLSCPADGFASSLIVCRYAAGTCDVLETCPGDGPDCQADKFAPAGTRCGAPSCSGNNWQVDACGGDGGCVPAGRAEACNAYTCKALDGGCPTNCAANVDCVAGLCDQRGRVCPATVSEVNCTDGGIEALSAAVAGCTAPCYLHLVRGTCNQISILNKDVYIGGEAGVAIDPAVGLSKGPAVSIRKPNTGTMKVGLAGLTIQGAYYGAANGVECMGQSGNNLDVALIGVTVQNNAGVGVSASSATITVDKTFVLNNTMGGLSFTNANFIVKNTAIGRNNLNGIFKAYGVLITTPGSPATFIHNTVAGNGYGGISCDKPVPILNSIVWGNGTSGAPDEVVGCKPMTGSHVEDEQQAQQCAGTPTFAADFHLGNAVCKDKISPCDPSVPVDIDGQTRPQPPAALCDVGADEVP